MKQYFVAFLVIALFLTSNVMSPSQLTGVVTAYLKSGGKQVVSPLGGVDKDGFKVPYLFEAAILMKHNISDKKNASKGSSHKKN